ncbi:spr-2 [Pristionchus pacificus]|uniref:Spr-2 n=1 Tax=Pristionchus pacificus TaxID=54126 RepID=A0A2A6C4N8_PRIPA|nr:spr-2 [Pristionchus pacificus]|eukprot:PDM73124.1 spr-2 [Pristionchus pacificus]
MSEEPTAKRSKVEDAEALIPSQEFDAIDNIQSELDALNDQAGDEIVKIEQKYNALRAPVYAKRSEAIKSVPNFWGIAFLNHPTLSSTVAEVEEGFIQHIHSIEVEEFADIKSGYKIKFSFHPNEYMETEQIEKEFHLTGDTPYSKVTPIVWKAGNNVLEQITRNRHPIPSDSLTFTEWLLSDSDPTMDEIAEIIKDDLWPNPVQYFLVPDIEEDDEEENGEGAE